MKKVKVKKVKDDKKMRQFQFKIPFVRRSEGYAFVNAANKEEAEKKVRAGEVDFENEIFSEWEVVEND